MIWLIEAFGWRSVYIFGGLMTVISIVLVLSLLPESPQYLYQRQPKNGQERLEQIARRLGYTGEVSLTDGEQPLPDENKTALTNFKRLLSPEFRRVSLVVWAGFFTVMFGFYFVSSWTPVLMNVSGLSELLAMFVTVMLTFVGAIGCVVFGLFTARWSTRLVLTWFTLLASVLMAVFVFTASWVPLVIMTGILVGFFANGCIAGLYTLTPQSYPTTIRSTGVGIGIGLGRIGAIIAPTITGSLTDIGWTPQAIYVGVGIFMLIAPLVLLTMRGLDVEANRSPRQDLEPASNELTDP